MLLVIVQDLIKILNILIIVFEFIPIKILI
jgi:hypothetical protein